MTSQHLLLLAANTIIFCFFDGALLKSLYKMAASLKNKRTPITSPPYQVTSVDVTPDTHIFSLVTTFKLPTVLRIRDILVRIRIRGSVPVTDGSGSGSYYFRHWPPRRQQKNYFFLLITFWSKLCECLLIKISHYHKNLMQIYQDLHTFLEVKIWDHIFDLEKVILELRSKNIF